MAGEERSWTGPELAQVIDHTLLAPEAGVAAIERLCGEALEHGFAAVCVNGAHVRRCARLLSGSDVAVACVVAFPLGACATEVKLHEARTALAQGARELDLVLNLGALKDGDERLVAEEIESACRHAHGQGALLKAILETALLTRDEKLRAARLCAQAGADFVKTSTGFARAGATVEDVALLRSFLGARIGIKAAGGIRSAAFARELLAAGATRLGCSASLAILAGD
jgi:deoxyribose-phosphate aldolase